MSEPSDDLKKLYEKRDYYIEWLRRLNEADEIGIEARRLLEETEWQIEALEEVPPEADEIPKPDLSQTLDSDIANLPIAFPFINQFEKHIVLPASAFSSTGTMSIYRYAARVGDLGTPDAIEYSDRTTERFRDLQHRQDRPDLLRKILSPVCEESTMGRLEAAIQSFESYLADKSNRRGPATDMRALIDGVIGDLFESARNRPSENMTWSRMASRLAIGGVQNSHRQEIEGLESQYSSLTKQLSDVIHDREAGSLSNIEHIWAEIQDFLVALIGHIRQV